MATKTKLGDIIVDLEARDVSMSRGLDNIEGQLKGFEGRLKGFGNLSKLAFGFNLGNAAFGMVHDGLSNLADGFMEAQKSGLDFFASIDEGLRSVMGLETKIGAAKKATDEWRVSHEQLAAMFKQAQSSFDQATGAPKPPPQFPFLPNPEEGDQSLEKARQAVRKASEAARPAQEAIAKAASQEAALREQQENIATRGSANLRQSLPALSGGRFVDESVADLKKRFRGVLGDLEIAEAELREKEAELAKKNAAGAIEWQRKADADERFADEQLAKEIKEREIAAERAGMDNINRIERDFALNERRVNDEEQQQKLKEREDLERKRSGVIDDLARSRQKPEQRPSFLALEDMARRIQMGAQKSQHEVEMEKLERESLANLKKINKKLGKPDYAVLQ